MKQASIDSDQKARAYFQKALVIGPHYARTYTGISLTYFNNWSGQQWSDGQANEKGVFDSAVKSISSDENAHISQMVMGRTLNYRR